MRACVRTGVRACRSFRAHSGRIRLVFQKDFLSRKGDVHRLSGVPWSHTELVQFCKALYERRVFPRLLPATGADSAVSVVLGGFWTVVGSVSAVRAGRACVNMLAALCFRIDWLLELPPAVTCNVTSEALEAFNDLPFCPIHISGAY